MEASVLKNKKDGLFTIWSTIDVLCAYSPWQLWPFNPPHCCFYWVLITQNQSWFYCCTNCSLPRTAESANHCECINLSVRLPRLLNYILITLQSAVLGGGSHLWEDWRGLRQVRAPYGGKVFFFFFLSLSLIPDWGKHHLGGSDSYSTMHICI